MDLVDGGEYDVVFSDALALFHHLPDDQEGDAEPQVDAGVLCGPDGDRAVGLSACRNGRKTFGFGVNNDKRGPAIAGPLLSL